MPRAGSWFILLAEVMGTTHMLIGGTTAVAVCATAGVHNAAAVALIGTAVVGSLLPDADDRNARIYHPTRTEKRYPLLLAAGNLARFCLLPVSLLPHRGPTHWPGTAAAVSWVCWVWVAAFVGAGMCVGYSLHLAADGCTKDGIPLWPNRRIWLLPGPLRIRTGKKAESALVFFWMAGTVLILAVII